MSVVQHEAGPSPRDCGHAGLEILGSQGNATVYRCLGCGRVVVVEGVNRRILRSTMLP